jgi:Tfp pilus assembly protein PilP
MRLRTIGLIATVMTCPALLGAQVGVKPASAAATPAAVTPPAAPQPPAAEPYSYNPDGRRDPFVSLVARGMQPDATGKRAEGLGGLTTAEMMLTGVLQSRGAYVALVKAPDGKTFTAHVNDHVADGTIRSINPQGMVIMQEVNDPLSLVKVKEVRKGLRASDDGKQ